MEKLVFEPVWNASQRNTVESLKLVKNSYDLIYYSVKKRIIQSNNGVKLIVKTQGPFAEIKK